MIQRSPLQHTQNKHYWVSKNNLDRPWKSHVQAALCSIQSTTSMFLPQQQSRCFQTPDGCMTVDSGEAHHLAYLNMIHKFLQALNKDTTKCVASWHYCRMLIKNQWLTNSNFYKWPYLLRPLLMPRTDRIFVLKNPWDKQNNACNQQDLSTDCFCSCHAVHYHASGFVRASTPLTFKLRKAQLQTQDRLP